MKFDYKIYPEHSLIITRLRGAFTLEDLTAKVAQLWADERYSRSYNGVVDLTDVNLTMSRGDFRALVEFIRAHKNTSVGRWAAVAASPFVTACGFLYQRAIAGRHTFEVFSTFEAAGSYVNVDLCNGPLAGEALVWAD